jgi:hypothetical protein
MHGNIGCRVQGSRDFITQLLRFLTLGYVTQEGIDVEQSLASQDVLDDYPGPELVEEVCEQVEFEVIFRGEINLASRCSVE